MRVPLSRHLGMEALALPVPPTLAGAFHVRLYFRGDLAAAAKVKQQRRASADFFGVQECRVLA